MQLKKGSYLKSGQICAEFIIFSLIRGKQILKEGLSGNWVKIKYTSWATLFVMDITFTMTIWRASYKMYVDQKQTLEKTEGAIQRHWVHKTQDEEENKPQHTKLKRWATHTQLNTRGWTQVLAKGKQFLLLKAFTPPMKLQKIPFNSLIKNNNSRDDTFNNTHILICNFYR